MPFFGGGGGDYHIVGTNIKGGNQALPATIGTNNMGLGNGALQSALGADNNIAIGNLSLNAVTTGNNNISIGYDSFPVLALGAYVVAVGGNTGAESTGSQESVIIGYGAFSSNLVQPHAANAAQQSVIIGTSAVPSGDVTSSVYIGAFARQGNAALSTNAVVIGANTLGLDSSVVIGAGASGDANSIAIGLNTVATANQIIIGDASYTSVQIGGITLASATGALFPSAIIGEPGTEGTGIVIGGVTYDSLFKVSDISSADIAQSIIHRHSTTWEPIQVFARSNSNGAGHGAVVNGMLLSSQYTAGWTGTEYNLFGRASFQASATGTISDASSPGDFVIATTPDGGTLPVEAVRIKSDKSTVFAGGVKYASVTFAGLPSAASYNGQIFFVSDVGVGGSFWVSNGVNWKLLNEYKMLYQLIAPTNFTNTVDAVIASIQIPSGLLKAGFIIRIQQKTTKNGTVDSIARNIRFGSTGTTADVSLASGGQPSATNTQVAEEQYYAVASSTSLIPLGTGALSWNGASGNTVINSVTVADMSLNNIFISISEYFASRTTETGTLAYFEVGLITP